MVDTLDSVALVILVLTLFLCWVAHREEVRRRGLCPRCGASYPAVEGEWDGEMYRCRKCGEAWHEAKR